MRLIKYFATLLCFLMVFAANAQQLLKGIVLDAEKNLPVPKASVFLNNTSIGTTANDDGRFQLSIPAGKYELIVSSIGYTTGSQPLSGNDVPDFLTIKMFPKVPELEAVVIEPYLKDGWEKWGQFFLEGFIGTSAQANDCKLLNKNVIRFRHSKKENKMTAHASEPLIIENKALGYRVRYDLEAFQYDLNTRYLLYAGYPFFEPLPANEKKKKAWNAKRKKLYYGSMMHFMRSVYRNTLEQEGFEVRRLKKIPNLEKERVKSLYRKQAQSQGATPVIRIGGDNAADSSDYYEAILRQPDSRDSIGRNVLPGDSIAFGIDTLTAGLQFPDYLFVLYKKGKVPREYWRLYPKNAQAMLSHIFLLNDAVISIQYNGLYYNPVNLISSGYWAWSEKIATMLPFDYVP